MQEMLQSSVITRPRGTEWKSLSTLPLGVGTCRQWCRQRSQLLGSGLSSSYRISEPGSRAGAGHDRAIRCSTPFFSGLRDAHKTFSSSSQLSWFLLRFSTRTELTKNAWVLAVILFQPALILIYHGHFQCNCSSLELAASAADALVAKREIAASMLFCLSFNHKQTTVDESMHMVVLQSVAVSKEASTVKCMLPCGSLVQASAVKSV